MYQVASLLDLGCVCFETQDPTVFGMVAPPMLQTLKRAEHSNVKDAFLGGSLLNHAGNLWWVPHWTNLSIDTRSSTSRLKGRLDVTVLYYFQQQKWYDYFSRLFFWLSVLFVGVSR
jgi:hypothetical protein